MSLYFTSLMLKLTQRAWQEMENATGRWMFEREKKYCSI